MKRLLFPVLMLIFALLVVGCDNKGKDTELVQPKDSETGSTTGSTGSGTGTTGDASGTTTGTSGSASTTGSTGSAGTSTGTSGTGMAPTENSSIDSSGAMIKHEEGKPAPAGQVWCENCKGHMPKEDAVTSSDGKSYCMACAAELKIKSN